ncbi:hypothetical protein [Paraburkholderia sp. BCC1886]|uniref:hypothetical protein n=1 Tax=Paraburkholderia sp. BCC1886 TaxID=2562670 RepID=UPI0011835151|nr:hypothetical protein [Paraburkholderia sp. BCC1886]
MMLSKAVKQRIRQNKRRKVRMRTASGRREERELQRVLRLQRTIMNTLELQTRGVLMAGTKPFRMVLEDSAQRTRDFILPLIEHLVPDDIKLPTGLPEIAKGGFRRGELTPITVPLLPSRNRVSFLSTLMWEQPTLLVNLEGHRSDRFIDLYGQPDYNPRYTGAELSERFLKFGPGDGPMRVLSQDNFERDPLTGCFDIVDHKSQEDIVGDIRDFVTRCQADSDYWNTMSEGEQDRLHAVLVERVANIPKEYPPGSHGYAMCFHEITGRWNARFPDRVIQPAEAAPLENLSPAERFFQRGIISYASIGKWYLASKNWTGFVIECPTGGDRDVIGGLLRTSCVIDGVERDVVAVELPATRILHEGMKIGLMVEGNFCDKDNNNAEQKNERPNQME